MFSAIISIISAIPALKSLFDEFVGFYVSQTIQSMNRENILALQKAIGADKDQRDLEGVIGNVAPGEKTNDPTTELRDSLPGVPPIVRKP